MSSIFHEWAKAWGVSPEAQADYAVRCGLAMDSVTPEINTGKSKGSETRQQALTRIEAANNGIWLTRNNVGVMFDEREIPVRYGLANESKQQNTLMKSGDTIGIRTLLIGPQHIGMKIGQFVSVEMKKEGWTYNSNDKHEVAQFNWANFVNSKGGFAIFCNGPESLKAQLKR